MELKTYLIDKSLRNRYINYKHEVKTDKGFVTYRLIEGDDELELKKQSNNFTPKRIYFGGTTYTTEDPTVQKFIESRSDFGKKIKIYDKAAESTAKLKEARHQSSLVQKAAKLEGEELAQVGYAVFGNKALKFLQENDSDGLQLDLMTYAQEYPSEFEELLKDKESKTVKLYLALAFGKGILKETDGGTSVSWGDTEEKIMTVSRGKKAIDDMVDFFKTEEGRVVRSIINTKLGEKSVEAELEVKTKK